MIEADTFITTLDEVQKSLFLDMISFTKGFSLDWFPDIPASKIMGLVLKLYDQGWIMHDNQNDFYPWSPRFPRQHFSIEINPKETAGLHGNTTDLPAKRLPDKERKTLRPTGQFLTIDALDSDIQTLLDAATTEEKNHQISTAIACYDNVIELIGKQYHNKPQDLSDNLRRAFIYAVKHWAGLSLFFPVFHDLNKPLFTALDMAVDLGDKNLQASIELMIGQNYWVSLQIKDAVQHLRRGWNMVQNLNDEEMEKRSLKLKMLNYLSQGNLFQAIDQHEHSIGNIESFDDDFSLFIFLSLGFIYTEVGMPQRGLGICEAMRNHCTKHANNPLLSYSYLMSGTILLEIRQLQSSKICLEKAVQIAKTENIFSLEVTAKIGLVCIACLEGHMDVAAAIYSTIELPHLSWYYLLNYFALFDTFYSLYGKNVLPDKGISYDFLNQIREDAVYPQIYNMIRRLLIVLPESNLSDKEKIAQLAELESIVEQKGSTFQLAKIRTEIAKLYLKTNDLPNAKIYAQEAWNFLKPIARDAFPANLLHLLPHSDLSKEASLSDLVIEMGNALATQDSIKGLLTNIIASLSRMTGAERSAIFIKDSESPKLKMVASRNLFDENILDEDFQPSFEIIRQVFNSGKENVSEREIADSEVIGKRKVVITPLMLNEQVIGVLYQDSRFFSLDISLQGINIISALASQIALAIDRAQAHDEIAKLNKKLIQENLYYLDEKEEFRPFGEIIGSSKAITEVQRLIRKVAPTQSAVLIYGETGVGKELVARAIHRESSRKNTAFIRVNCAALPESLIDSELFGHEKGAFTGAIKTKAGRFELAHQGTIFLDEVSELPPSTQSRLLRILQEKEFQRVGGTKLLYSDFRLITATNKDLKKEVEAGRFREDLFYRLNVYPIRVPPLRERREDIPALAIYFLKLLSSQCGKPYSGITTAEMEKLQSYSWPGNIRELSNIIERTVISGDAQFRFAELTGNSTQGENRPEMFDKTLNLIDFEKKLILKALERSGGIIGGKCGASELLGIKRTTLIHRMKKLSIKVEHYRSLNSS